MGHFLMYGLVTGSMDLQNTSSQLYSLESDCNTKAGSMFPPTSNLHQLRISPLFFNNMPVNGVEKALFRACGSQASFFRPRSPARGGVHLGITESLRRCIAFKKLSRQAHELLLRLDFAFLENVVRVGVHRVQRNDELIADERAAAPRKKERANLRLSLGESVFFLE